MIVTETIAGREFFPPPAATGWLLTVI